MFRSISNRTSSNGINACNDESTRRKSIPINFCNKRKSIKKAFSLIFHPINSATCNSQDDTEMHEFIPYTSSEENLNTIHRTTSNISDNTIMNQTSLFPHASTVHHKLSRWKNRFRHRCGTTKDDHEKNDGYLVVLNPDAEPILLSNDCLDHQQTQHAQPCVQINDDTFDLNQIQYSSMIPNVSPSAPPLPSLVPYLSPYEMRTSNELEVQLTRSSIECGIPQADVLNIHETQMSHVISVTSTNSSDHEYTGIDRTLLNDTEYVRAQELDLHRIIDFEIDLLKEQADLQYDLEDELELDSDHKKILEQNLNLKNQLQRLQEEYDRIYSSWSCELCTFINEPYIDTRRDTCDMCESPSPLKRATLTQ